MIRDILPFPERYWLILNLMGAAHLKKIWDGGNKRLITK